METPRRERCRGAARTRSDRAGGGRARGATRRARRGALVPAAPRCRRPCM